PVPTETVQRQRPDLSIVWPQGCRVCRCAGIDLTLRAVRKRKPTNRPRISIIPASRQPQTVREAVIQTVLCLVGSDGFAQPARSRKATIRIRCRTLKRCGSLSRVQRWNIATEEPQPVRY